ncbi:hypothetical protein BLA60_01960 [Actinophytocola xinjiangensis]|uniref:YbaB/EbfC DNA-binding family protein n=1 Tax=Actinophytocola xinjiangensis TaxID=485602 RepID=A0A7Z0WSK8_9PSEU|nr:YbaB/EbfC family nucleoid-associated protein [Actinophytocola xinjiangensis]OLF13967.1 hypothetical protein BLA60_01960 [Actinophytocola xinjiangensis]
MARFGFTAPEDDTEGEPDTAERAAGVGVAVDARIRAVVGVDGRLRELAIDPGLLGRPGDAAALAGAIIDAVNAAMDDLVRQAVPGTDGIAAVGVGFERALDGVRADLERAEQRIADR